MILLKLTNLILLLAATAWLTSNMGWETFIPFFTLLSTYIFQEVKDSRKLAKRDESVKFDRDLFLKYDNCLPEKELLYGLNTDLGNFRTDYGFVNRIKNYLRLAESVEGEFVDTRIQKDFVRLREALTELQQFVAAHFFSPSHGVDKNSAGDPLLFLYPDLKYADDAELRERYKSKSNELQAIIVKVIERYTAFRKSIKKHHFF